jgi:long-subunit fatty acid transport protein
LFAVYNLGQVGAGNLATYIHMGVAGGGGTVKWDDGVVATYLPTLSGGTAVSVEASSVYYAVNVGASYASKDNTVAVSLGGRLIMAKKTMEMTVKANGATAGEMDYDATGFAPIIGLAVKPIQDLTLSARYEFETELEFEYSAKGSLAGKDGFKPNENLPGAVFFGAEYKVNSDLVVGLAYNKYYISQTAIFGDDLYRSGWELSVGATYKVMPALRVGAGLAYSDIGVENGFYDHNAGAVATSPEAARFLSTSTTMPMSSIILSCGVIFEVMPGLDLTAAFGWQHFLPESFKDTSGAGAFKGEYRKEYYATAIGVSYKAF